MHMHAAGLSESHACANGSSSHAPSDLGALSPLTPTSAGPHDCLAFLASSPGKHEHRPSLARPSGSTSDFTSVPAQNVVSGVVSGGLGYKCDAINGGEGAEAVSSSLSHSREDAGELEGGGRAGVAPTRGARASSSASELRGVAGDGAGGGDGAQRLLQMTMPRRIMRRYPR